jgi:hypothetical protein
MRTFGYIASSLPQGDQPVTPDQNEVYRFDANLFVTHSDGLVDSWKSCLTTTPNTSLAGVTTTRPSLLTNEQNGLNMISFSPIIKRLATSSNLNDIPTGNNSRVLYFVVKSMAPNGNSYEVMTGWGADISLQAFTLAMDTNNTGLGAVFFGNNNLITNMVATSNVQILALTYDGTTNDIRLYRDGVLIGSANYVLNTLIGELAIGSVFNQNSSAFKVGEMRIYNTVHDEATVISHTNSLAQKWGSASTALLQDAKVWYDATAVTQTSGQNVDTWANKGATGATGNLISTITGSGATVSPTSLNNIKMLHMYGKSASRGMFVSTSAGQIPTGDSDRTVMFFINNITSTTNTWQILATWGTNLDNQMFNVAIWSDSSVGLNSACAVNVWRAEAGESLSGISNAAPHILFFSYKNIGNGTPIANSIQIQKDGVNLAVVAGRATNTPLNTAASSLIVGYQPNIPLFGAEYDVGDIAIWDRSLSTAEKNDVIKFINSKYGLNFPTT